MTNYRFALIILIAFILGPNALAAAGDGEVAASDVSERKPVGAASVAVLDSKRAVGQTPWRIRRAKNAMGSIVFDRNETAAPLLVSFAGKDSRPSGEPVPPGGTAVRHCDAGKASYPLAIASEQGESVLDAQTRCGDSVVVQSDDGATFPPLEAINEAWALPPGESVAEPLDMVH